MDKERFLSMFDVDFATGRIFWKKPPKNHAEKEGREAGYLCLGKGKNKDYWHIRAFSMTFKRSRLIFFLHHGFWPTPSVDHINGDSLDDSITNLRQCTHAQNAANILHKKRRHDLPKGVTVTKQGLFMARITKLGTTRSLGVFRTPEIAKEVYQKARKETFGEFA